MLILTRRPCESIILGNNIQITVLGVKAQQVTLGIQAPLEVSIHREEVYRRIQEEKLDLNAKRE